MSKRRLGGGRRWARQVGRWVALCLLALLSLQLYFGGRVLLMRWVDPQSTAFQRSEILRLWSRARQGVQPWHWAHEWRDETQISVAVKQAVMAAEDSGFTTHTGIEWDALVQAWTRNAQAQHQADQTNERWRQWSQATGRAVPPQRWAQPRMVGGSTITQQLAKNLFLSGERHVWRKAQEGVVSLMLEAVLSKRRILEIYLNHVEWGEGVFGIQAAAQHYGHRDAQQLSASQAARLAVMLPAPKRFERRRASPYLEARAQVVLSRMPHVALP